MPLDKDKQAHVAAVRAAAESDGPGETAAAELRQLFGSIPVLPPSSLRIDVDDGPHSQTQGEPLLLGSGKYAEVFEGSVRLSSAADAAEQPCAIKRLRATRGLQAERLLQEALTLMRCQNPDTEPLLLAVVLGGGHYYLVFKRFGGTLKQYIQEHEPSPAEVQQLLLRCARLLRSVHAERVCHNDVKADNFLISEDGEDMVLCDFGFAVHPELMFLPDRVRGTPKFYAPELRGVLKRAEKVEQGAEVRRSTRGATLPDNRLPADAFSFGAMIQECVSDELEPYPDLSNDEWIDMATHRPEELADNQAELAEEYKEIKELMKRCCSLQLDQRPTIDSVCRRLDLIVKRAKKMEAKQPHRPQKPKPKPADPSSRRRRVVVPQHELNSEEEEPGEEVEPAQPASQAHSHSQQQSRGRRPTPAGSYSAFLFTAASGSHRSRSTQSNGAEEMKDEADVTVSQPASGIFPCKGCSESFPTYHSLRSHSVCHQLLDGETATDCTQCPGVFRSPGAMRRHLKKCTGNKHAASSAALPAAAATALTPKKQEPCTPRKRPRSERPTPNVTAASPLSSAHAHSLSKLEQAANVMEQSSSVATDGQKAARMLLGHFPVGGDAWLRRRWMTSFWQHLAPHLQRELTLCVHSESPSSSSSSSSLSSPSSSTLNSTRAQLSPASLPGLAPLGSSSAESSTATSSPPLLPLMTSGVTEAAAASRGNGKRPREEPTSALHVSFPAATTAHGLGMGSQSSAPVGSASGPRVHSTPMPVSMPHSHPQRPMANASGAAAASSAAGGASSWYHAVTSLMSQTSACGRQAGAAAVKGQRQEPNVEHQPRG